MSLEAKSFKSTCPKNKTKHKQTNKKPLPVPSLWGNNFSLENQKEWFLHFEISDYKN